MPLTIYVKYSASRSHSIALDKSNSVWVFNNWGRPAKLSSDLLTHSSIVQVEAGWDALVALNETGTAFVIRQEGKIFERISEHNRNLDAQGERTRVPLSNDGTLPCTWWELDADPVELPEIPDGLPQVDEEVEDARSPTKIVEVAAGDKFLVALTNKGHVLKMDFEGDDDDGLRTAFLRKVKEWQYVSEGVFFFLLRVSH